MSDERRSSLRAIDIGRRPALAGIVEERIRDAIMFGDLELGEPISEDRLASRLGVSRTPVREALTALSLQGLVSIQPQRGSYVFSPSDQDIQEICAYRFWIESRALALAHGIDKPGTIAAMKDADAAMRLAETAGDHAGAAKADAAFHGAFIERCGNRLLVQAYTLVSGRVGAIRYFARLSRGAKSYSGAQHRDIIAAFDAGDLAAADRILETHVMNMRAHFAEAKAAHLGEHGRGK